MCASLNSGTSYQKCFSQPSAPHHLRACIDWSVQLYFTLFPLLDPLLLMHKFNEFANLNLNVCIPEQRDKLPKVFFTTLSTSSPAPLHWLVSTALFYIDSTIGPLLRMHKFNEFANLNSNVCIPEQRDKLPKVLVTTLSTSPPSP